MDKHTVAIDEMVQNGVAVLTPHGPIVNKLSLVPFRERMIQLAKCGITRIVLDLSQEKWIGAALLGELVREQDILRNAGGNLCLAGVSDKIRRILNVTALSDRFPTFKTVARAIACIGSNPATRAA